MCKYFLVYDLQHLSHLTFEEIVFKDESMELVELWLCDLVILINMLARDGRGRSFSREVSLLIIMDRSGWRDVHHLVQSCVGGV